MGHLLDVRDLRVEFLTDEGVVRAVNDVSFFVDAGEVVCLVGESGSGKTATCMTILGLTRGQNARCGGEVYFHEMELVTAKEGTLRQIRGSRIALVPQDPMSALNPVHRVGDQISEQIRAHEKVSAGAAQERSVELMRRVGIPHPRERARSFVHEFSGGMRQRVMIAMALSCSPELILADEPTTALDVTIQAQILAELDDLCREVGASLLFVTHDFGVVADIAARVIVMYCGRVVEEASVSALFEDPMHPYTWGLLGSVPRADRPRVRRLPAIGGTAPSLVKPPTGCSFRPRCPVEFDRCAEVPPLAGSSQEDAAHRDRCWHAVEDKRRLRVVDGAVALRAK
jgi:oligopeptide/dipeptide ABC transporter ATP-binding protein